MSFLPKCTSQRSVQWLSTALQKALTLPKKDFSTTCAGCVLNEPPLVSIPKATESSSTQLLQLVQDDVPGSAEPVSLSGARCIVFYSVDFSKRPVVDSKTHKSKALLCFKGNKVLTKEHNSTRLTRVHVHEYYTSALAQVDDGYCLRLPF